MAQLDPLPLPGTFSPVFPASVKDCIAALDRLIDASIALPDGQIEGGVIRFSVADGHAFYYVKSESPLILQHIPFLDAYEIDAATIRGLNREDVVELIRQERSLRSLLAPRKPPAQPPAPRVIAPGPLAW